MIRSKFRSVQASGRASQSVSPALPSSGAVAPSLSRRRSAFDLPARGRLHTVRKNGKNRCHPGERSARTQCRVVHRHGPSRSLAARRSQDLDSRGRWIRTGGPAVGTRCVASPPRSHRRISCCGTPESGSRVLATRSWRSCRVYAGRGRRTHSRHRHSRNSPSRCGAFGEPWWQVSHARPSHGCRG